MATSASSVLEALESRQLFSAGSTLLLHDNLKLLPAASSSTAVQGYTPAQIKNAYGFNQITLSNGAAADGSGQTIAIVDAFNDPNIRADLSVFDQQFGLSTPNLTIENQTGGSTLPSTDTGWAGEISLDVEWAHAIAPAAKILLVEANSSSLTDLLAAVNTARDNAAVSVVSASWGGSEFFSYHQSESSSELADDSFFTTPAGHQGITFVASAGDSGSFSGVQWPAVSPNVLSVGGTGLTTSDASGTYAGEQSWSGTSGGFSQFEATPSYQLTVNSSGARTAPDVAYNADPNTGFAVYDSLAETSGGQTYVGWQEVGGTSAGAPQWAALVAIADQARAITGQSTLNGASQTLPILYSLYTATNSAGASTYTNYFNDIIDSGPSNPFQFPFGGFGNNGGATSGYDIVTGLGTPKAGAIVDALSGQATIGGSGTGTGTSTGSGSGTGTGTGTSGGSGSTSAPVIPTLPASPLVATIVSAQSGEVVGSESGTVKIRVVNTGTSRYVGPIEVALYATTDGTVSSTDTAFATIPVSRISVAAGSSKTITLHFAYPGNLATGTYTLVASVTASNTGTAPSQAVAPAAITIATPTVDLATRAANSKAVLVKPGHHSTAAVTITNNGNVTASGTLSINLYASSDENLDASDVLLTTLLKKISLKPGKSITLNLRFTGLAQAGGTYDLIASATSATQPADTNSSDKTAVLGTR